MPELTIICRRTQSLWNRHPLPTSSNTVAVPKACSEDYGQCAWCQTPVWRVPTNTFTSTQPLRRNPTCPRQLVRLPPTPKPLVRVHEPSVRDGLPFKPTCAIHGHCSKHSSASNRRKAALSSFCTGTEDGASLLDCTLPKGANWASQMGQHKATASARTSSVGPQRQTCASSGSSSSFTSIWLFSGLKSSVLKKRKNNIVNSNTLYLLYLLHYFPARSAHLVCWVGFVSCKFLHFNSSFAQAGIRLSGFCHFR